MAEAALPVCPRTPQPNCASHPISCPIVLPDTSRREAKAKTGWEDGPIYTASQDPQVDRRAAHFRKRARGVKIGPSEEVREGRGVVRKDVENVSKSVVEARSLGTLGGRSLKKG